MHQTTNNIIAGRKLYLGQIGADFATSNEVVVGENSMNIMYRINRHRFHPSLNIIDHEQLP